MECKTFSFQFLRTFEDLCFHASNNTTNSMMLSAFKKNKIEVEIKANFEKKS